MLDLIGRTFPAAIGSYLQILAILPKSDRLLLIQLNITDRAIA
ncbi:MAG: hypothetical protein ACP5D7_15620 [Limnospira sp.]